MAVLDSSALLALLWSEPGAEAVGDFLLNARMSAVNLAEVYAKMADRGVVGDEVRTLLSDLALHIVPFDQEHAAISGDLRVATRGLGLSLGDRACLALARAEEMEAVTCDKSWSRLDLQIRIVPIR